MNVKSLAILYLLIIVSSAICGTTGKIAGHITDLTTGEPLPGVNIVIEDQNLGAATDLNGFYYIINIPPGKHKIILSYVGYKTLTYEDVEVEVNRTITINLAMEQDILESGDIIVVTAKREVIKKDLTMSSQYVEKKEIMALPVDGFESVTQMQAGASDGHFRGGRATEVMPIIDGVNVTDPGRGYEITSITRDEEYLQTSLLLPASAIEQIEVITGGFNAEYGNAQSAVVNVMTREGGVRHSGRLVAKYNVLNHNSKRYWYKNNKGEYVYSRDRELAEFYMLAQPDDSLRALGARGPSMVNNAYLNNSQTYNLNDFQRQELEFSFTGPVPFTDKAVRYSIHGELIDKDELQFSYYGPQFQGAFQAKITYRASPGNNFQLSALGSMINSRDLYHWSGKFPGGYYPGYGYMPHRIDQEAYNYNRNLSTSLKWTHSPSNRTFIEIQSGVNYNSFEQKVIDWNDRDGDGDFDEFLEWRKLPIPDNPIDSLTSWTEQYTLGTAEMKYYWVPAHEPSGWKGGWKWGVPGVSGWQNIWVLNPSDYTYKQEWRYLTGTTNEQELTPYPIPTLWESSMYPNVPSGYFDIYGDPWNRFDIENITYHFRANLTSQVSLYHLLKFGFTFELTDMDVFRNQWNYPYQRLDIYHVKPFDISTFIQDRMEFEGLILNAGFRMDYFNQGNDIYYPGDLSYPIDESKSPSDSGYILNPVEAKPFLEFSPRLGISHPISDNAVLHFSYGHFYQRPDYRLWYNNRGFDLEYGPPWTGSPNLMPEKTISYEAGYKQSIGEFFFNINVFYKDIINWTSRYPAGRPPEFVYSILTNRSWADVRGIEFILRKHFSNYFSLHFNYTYQIAKGSASDPYQTGIEGARQPIYLDWDRRHVFNANLSIGLPANWGPTLGNLSILGDWDLTILYRYKSGLPYTAPSRDPVPRENTERLDPIMQTDLKFSKRIAIGMNLRLLLLIEGYNIFNRPNLLYIQDVEYWEETGNPEGRNYNPGVWGSRRHFRIGLGFEF